MDKFSTETEVYKIDRDSFSLQDIFKDDVEKYSLNILEERNNGITIRGLYPKNTFVIKEFLIDEIIDRLKIKSRLSKYDWEVSVPVLIGDMNSVFLIDIKERTENSSKNEKLYKVKNIETASQPNKVYSEKELKDLFSSYFKGNTNRETIQNLRLFMTSLDYDDKYVFASKLVDNIKTQDMIDFLNSTEDYEVTEIKKVQENSCDFSELKTPFIELSEVNEDSKGFHISYTDTIQDETFELSAKSEKKLYRKLKNQVMELSSVYNHKVRLFSDEEALNKNIEDSAINLWQTRRKVQRLNSKLEDLEVVLIKDEEGDYRFYVINPEVNMDEYLEVLEFLKRQKVLGLNRNTKPTNTRMAKDDEYLPELGFGGGDTYQLFWSWKETEMDDVEREYGVLL